MTHKAANVQIQALKDHQKTLRTISQDHLRNSPHPLKNPRKVCLLGSKIKRKTRDFCTALYIWFGVCSDILRHIPANTSVLWKRFSVWTSTGFGGEPGVLVVLVLCVSSVSGTGAWAKRRWGKSQKKVVVFFKKRS